MLTKYICLYCGKDNLKYISPSGFKRGMGKFCNFSCKGKFKIGNRNANYRGNKIKYQMLHIWIASIKGKPKVCERCKTTTAKKYEWSNISGEYKRDVNDWQRLCASCHRRYDVKSYINSKVGETKRIKQFSRYGIFIKEYNSLGEAARELGINQGNITNAASGRCPTVGGFIWKYS